MNEQHHAEESRNGVARSLAGLIATLCETLGRLVTGKKANVDFCTREDLEQMEQRIIMALNKDIAAFGVAQNAALDRIDASIVKLQSGPVLSTEDLSTLSGVQGRTEAVASQLEAVTPPTPTV